MEELTIIDIVDRGTTLALAVYFVMQGARVVERLLNTLDAMTGKCLKMHDEQSMKRESTANRSGDD